MMQFLTEFQGKKLINIAKGDLDLGDLADKEEKEEKERFKPNTNRLSMNSKPLWATASKTFV